MGEDAYPHWQDQVWAEPDIEVAAAYMAKLVEDPNLGRAIGERASRHIRINSGYRATGIRYLRRLEAI